MATSAKRRTYLDSALPSEWNEYATGSRTTPFVSVGSNLGALYGADSPTLIGALFDRKSAFESKDASKGDYFQRFLNIQRNPDALIQGKMKLPAGFLQGSNLASAFGD